MATRVVNEFADLRPTLERILEEAIGLLEADEGSVMLHTTDRSALVISAARGLPDEVVASTLLPVGSGIAGYVADTGTPLLLGSDEEVSSYGEPRRTRPLRSAVSVPLRTAGRVEGVLNVNLVADGATRPAFGDADLEAVTVFAEVAASAVRHAQLYGQARRRGDDLAKLYEAGHRLSGAVEVTDVADCALDAAAEFVDARGGFVVALPHGDRQPDIVQVRDIARGRVMAVLRREGGLATLLRTNGVRTTGDVASDPVLGPLGAGHEPMGAVTLPLLESGRPVGLLVVLTPPGGPDEHRVRLLSTYSSQVGVALTRAVLFRDARSKQDELTSLAGSVPDPIVIVDGEARFLAINPAAGELFGLSPEFELGEPVHGKLRSEELESLLLADEPVRAEITLLTPEPHTYRARATQARPGHGPTGARILTLEDITAEKEATRLKADFVAVVGHELRTPLTLIKGYSGTLAKRGDTLSPDARTKALENLDAQAQRLERLVEDLLLVSRVERDRPPLHIEDRDVVKVLREVVEAGRAANPGREIHFEEPESERVMPLDVTKVEQVMRHLLDNAVKFSDGDTTVTVELELRDDTVEVRVRDRGAGIFSGDVPRLFERFHQVDGSATRSHGGTGIGLHICKTLVEAHGGHIGVSTALGRGSTFWFTLPTVPPSSDAEQAGLVG